MIDSGTSFALIKIIKITQTAVRGWLVSRLILNKLFNFNNLLGSKRNNQTIVADQLGCRHGTFALSWCKGACETVFWYLRYPRIFIHILLSIFWSSRSGGS